MISEVYQYTHDIDWFCIINNRLVHFASNGYKIPVFYRNLDLLHSVQSFVERMESNRVPRRNQSRYIDRILRDGYDANNDQSLEQYYHSFQNMASRGLYSYDCAMIDGEMLFHLVAHPSEPIFADFISNEVHLFPAIQVDFPIDMIEADVLLQIINESNR